MLPDRLLLYVDDGDAAVAAVLTRGASHPTSVLVRRSTLEDVFLRLTGRDAGRLTMTIARRRAARRLDPPPDAGCAGLRPLVGASRRTWRGSVVTTFLVPVLNLLALGYGLGAWSDPAAASTASPYVAFLGPGLLATSAMTTRSRSRPGR